MFKIIKIKAASLKTFASQYTSNLVMCYEFENCTRDMLLGRLYPLMTSSIWFPVTITLISSQYILSQLLNESLRNAQRVPLRLSLISKFLSKFGAIGQAEPIVRRCSVKKLFLQNSQYSQQNTCWRLFLIKLQHTWRHATLLKRDSNTGVFLRILQNFLRASILKNICERLLLSKFR